MKVSFLCVTENRPEFMPWLLWNYDRQEWPDKELIIVDSSPTPFKTKQKDARVVAAAGNVPTKRNIALGEASGEYVTWLDDDDWRHPGSVPNLMAAMAEADVDVAGGRVTWFTNLFTEETRRLIMRRGVLFAATLAKTETARSVLFEESVDKGTDITWMEALLKANSFAFSYEAPSLFLCHDRNMGNGAYRHHFNRSIDDPQAVIGKKVWGDTRKQLAALRKRLGD